MGVIESREARREGSRLLIGIAGTSSSGKTYTALRLAYGLANGNAKKIGFLDTENRRGSLYAEILPNKERFIIGDLLPPFSPDRYIAGIKHFQGKGSEVLIIDSVTHEWEGEGGCCDIAENNKLGDMPNWAMAKGMHKRFMNTLLYCDMHIIACIRAREKAKPQKVRDEKTGRMKTVYVPIGDGPEPVCEKNFMFEMTVSMVMEDLGRKQRIKKCDPDLLPYLGRGTGYITEEDGFAIRRWVDGHGELDAGAEQARNILQMTCADGTEALKNAWESTPKEIKVKLGAGFLETVKASAAEYDRQRAEAAAGVPQEAGE